MLKQMVCVVLTVHLKVSNTRAPVEVTKIQNFILVFVKNADRIILSLQVLNVRFQRLPKIKIV